MYSPLGGAPGQSSMSTLDDDDDDEDNANVDDADSNDDDDDDEKISDPIGCSPGTLLDFEPRENKFCCRLKKNIFLKIIFCPDS